jgi:hypothetical protein
MTTGKLFTLVRFAFLAPMALWCAASWSQVTVFPQSPKAQETVRARVPQSAWTTAQNPQGGVYDTRQTLVTMAGNKISVSVQVGADQFGFPGPPPGLDLPLGQFPPGSYEVEVTMRSASGASLGPVGTASFTVAARDSNQPAWNVTGLWWNPAESGWGLNVIENGDGNIFATWFVYGEDGKATWYHVPGGRWIDRNEFQGTIYRTTGPFLRGCPESACPNSPFDPAAVVRTPVGTAVIGFSPVNPDKGGVVFRVDGLMVVKSIERLNF